MGIPAAPPAHLRRLDLDFLLRFPRGPSLPWPLRAERVTIAAVTAATTALPTGVRSSVTSSAINVPVWDGSGRALTWRLLPLSPTRDGHGRAVPGSAQEVRTHIFALS